METSSAETGSSQTIELGLDRERARDHDALALAAGKFVRVAAHMLALQPDLDEQARHAILPLACRGGELVDRQRFTEDRADGHARIERGERVLEHDLHLAPQGAQVVAAEAQHVLPVKDDLARGRLDQAQDAAAGGGLAAAGFADHSQRLAAIDRERHAVHRMDAPTSRDNRPPRTGKCFLRLVTCSRGSLIEGSLMAPLPDGRPCDGPARSRATPAPVRCRRSWRGGSAARTGNRGRD